MRAVERIGADTRTRWRVTAHRCIPGEARYPPTIATRQTRKLLFDGPQFGGRDLADDAIRCALTSDMPNRRACMHQCPADRAKSILGNLEVELFDRLADLGAGDEQCPHQDE